MQVKVLILLITLIVEGFIIKTLVDTAINLSSNSLANNILSVGIGIISIIGVGFLALKLLGSK
jgi:hypothetical protein